MSDWNEIEVLENRRNMAAAAARAIEGGFVWVDTPQGASYWVDVHNALLDIIQDASTELVCARAAQAFERKRAESEAGA